MIMVDSRPQSSELAGVSISARMRQPDQFEMRPDVAGPTSSNTTTPSQVQLGDYRGADRLDPAGCHRANERSVLRLRVLLQAKLRRVELPECPNRHESIPAPRRPGTAALVEAGRRPLPCVPWSAQTSNQGSGLGGQAAPARA